MKKKVILFLHGAIGSKKQLFPLYESLREDHEIFLLNFSGHGGEKIPDKAFSIEMFAKDVLDWISTSKYDSVNIFGYSMGGYVGMYLVKHHAYLVDKLFTFATKFDWTEETAEREVKMLNSSKIKEKVPKFAEILSERHHPENWEKVLEKTCEMMLNLGKKNVLSPDDYNGIEHTILTGVGDKDTMVTIDETLAVYKKLVNGQMLVLPDTPHPIEKISSERLAAEIRNFFK